jgi:ABC-type transporter Mla MlaB component
LPGSGARAPRPDLGTVEALCELQRAAQRLGCTVRVHDASAELREVINLAGLAEVLLADPEGPREAENRGGGRNR